MYVPAPRSERSSVVADKALVTPPPLTVKLDIVTHPAPQQPSVASSPNPITSPALAEKVTEPD